MFGRRTYQPSLTGLNSKPSFARSDKSLGYFDLSAIVPFHSRQCNFRMSKNHPMNLNYIIISLVALALSALANEPVEKSISKAPDRDAEVIGRIPKDGEPSLKLVAGGTEIWNCGLGWSYPSSSIVSWSPYSTKVAISVRTTKTTSEIHVFDLWEQKREIRIPDLVVIASALVGNVPGRVLLIAPVGWAGEDNLLVEASGNLVDEASSDTGELSFHYVFTIHLPTGRIVSAVCSSQHDLNDERIKRPIREKP